MFIEIDYDDTKQGIIDFLRGVANMIEAGYTSGRCWDLHED